MWGIRLSLITVLVWIISGCGVPMGSSSGNFSAAAANSNTTSSTTPSPAPTPNPTPSPMPSFVGKNTAPIAVGCGYDNEPCVSVTICNPTTQACQTVNNILLDTGSYGLRVFGSTIQNLGLTPVTAGANQVAECEQYLDGTSDWGSVAMAKVQIGQEMTSQAVPIQIIDANFPEGQPQIGGAAKAANCPNPDTSPLNDRFNGILGVGLFVTDCGPGCAQNANNTMYFSCTSAGQCSGLTVPEGGPGQNLPLFQVSNPVAFMPFDNNGVVVSLPAVPATGAANVTGMLYLGIGTQTNNTGTGLMKFVADSNGNFKTTFEGTTYSSSFIDSGSVGLYFPQTGTNLMTETNMNTQAYGWFNPSAAVPFTATQSDGTTTYKVNFQINNADVLLANGNQATAFNNLGAPLSSVFDWGLPFFFGRSIYVGIYGMNSNLGKGPYWAY